AVRICHRFAIGSLIRLTLFHSHTSPIGRSPIGNYGRLPIGYRSRTTHLSISDLAAHINVAAGDSGLHPPIFETIRARSAGRSRLHAPSMRPRAARRCAE